MAGASMAWGTRTDAIAATPSTRQFRDGVRPTQVRERDAHLVGEYVECLRAFGSDDSDPLIQLGMTFLLRAQDPATHRWDVGGDAYTSYHATMVACQALLVHTHRGYGPGSPVVRRCPGKVARGRAARRRARKPRRGAAEARRR